MIAVDVRRLYTFYKVMKQTKKKLCKVARQVRGLFPKKLPITKEEFAGFYKWLQSTYEFPDTEGYEQAVASMIQHLGPTTVRKAPYFFAISIAKARANETAFYVMQDIKKKAQEAKAKLEKEKDALELPQKSEVQETASSVV